MALNLPSATLVSYTSRGDFFGENIARWRTVQTVTVEGVMDPDQINNMVNSTGETDYDLPTSANSYLGNSVAINGVSTDNSRLISIEFPTGAGSITEMHDGHAKYVATYEVYITSGSSFFGLTFNDLKSLESFSEDISFELSENNNYSINWNMEVKYASGNGGGVADAIAAAKTLWTAVTSSTPASIPTSMQGNGINIWTKQDSSDNGIHWYESETYDKQSNSCNFSRTRNLLSNNTSDNYTYAIKSILNLDADGSISVSEEGEVVGLSDSGSYTSVSARMDAAKTGVEALISGSYARCSSLYTNYSSSHGSSLSLIDQYKDKSVSYSEEEGKIIYSISYVDNDSYDTVNKYIFSSQISQDLEGSDVGQFDVYTEEGEITSFYRTSIGSVTSAQQPGWMYKALMEKMADCPNRIAIMHGSAPFSSHRGAGGWFDTGVYLISSKISYKPNGKQASFVRKYSLDPSFIDAHNNNIAKITVSVDTDAGVTKKEWFNPPNNPVGGEFPHVGNEIVEPSTRKINIKGRLPRNISVQDTSLPAGTQYNAASYLPHVIKTLPGGSVVSSMQYEAINVFSEYYLPVDSLYWYKCYFSNLDWSFNSDYEISASLEMKYIVPIGPHPTYPALHSDNTQITI